MKTTPYVLPLTELERQVLRIVIEDDLLDRQGDGTLTDEMDDALVSLNAKLAAIASDE